MLTTLFSASAGQDLETKKVLFKSAYDEQIDYICDFFEKKNWM